MNSVQVEQTKRRLATPRAAAVAGILFAVLFGTSQVLLRLAIPESLTDRGALLANQARSITLALSLIPFSGIAFLWFIGVVRDRLGEHEDRFFSTVFLGSGLLYLAMVFVAAGLAGGLLASYSANPQLLGDPFVLFSRTVMRQISNIYSLRMAGVFMTSLATMFLRTGVMPRWVALFTYGFALLLLLSVSLTMWLTLVFPAWVFLISVLILIGNYRRGENRDEQSTPSTSGTSN
jgi:MFS family permease